MRSRTCSSREWIIAFTWCSRALAGDKGAADGDFVDDVAEEEDEEGEEAGAEEEGEGEG